MQDEIYGALSESIKQPLSEIETETPSALLRQALDGQIVLTAKTGGILPGHPGFRETGVW